MATAVGVAVLEYFGIRAEPVPVYVWVLNPIYAGWLESGQPGGAPPEGSRFVAIDERSKTAKFERKGWPGHLLVGVEGQALVDLDLQAFQRPEKGIDLPAAEWFEAYAEPGWEFDVNGSHLVYVYTDDQTFRRSVDWKHREDETLRHVIGNVIRGIR